MTPSMIAAAGSLAVATFASEDLACIAAGLLVARGDISGMTGVLSCTAGIVAGDVGLWAIGRACGEVAFRWRWLAGRVDEDRIARLREWLEQRGGQAILSSRFLPGTRLPLYLAAGVVRMSGVRFAFWALVAAALWTPALVLTSAALGAQAATRLPLLFGALALTALGARMVAVPSTRARLRALAARYARWEFWPMWLFYLPVAVRIALLSRRYGGLSTITAANPGMPDGGTVGESKADILSRLPADWTIPFVLIDAGQPAERTRVVLDAMSQRGWGFPIVLKPDVGQRGAGVRLVRSASDVGDYVRAQAGPVLAQPYHCGPFEAGIFYYRRPGDARGRILSITDKHFPFVTGDGVSTLEELIWRHPRYRMQAQVFLTRHHEVRDRVPAAGERLQLAIAGNHAQGTLFLDGGHLITPALERRIDDIARAYPGFFIGRFDVRYGDVEAFKAGLDLAIVELNGATAESTNIYDPDSSLVEAYRQLFRQWSLVFEIGAANRTTGAPVTSIKRMLVLARTHLSTPVAFSVSD